MGQQGPTISSSAGPVYTATELARLLEDVGFAELECFGDLDGEELSRESRLVVRARKPVT